MAIPMIKATYTLDPDTVRALEAMARRLGVSKSEALRRAIRAAAGTDERDDRVAAFEQMQQLMALTPRAAEAWVKAVRDERRASDRSHRYAVAEPARKPRKVAETPASRRR